MLKIRKIGLSDLSFVVILLLWSETNAAELPTLCSQVVWSLDSKDMTISNTAGVDKGWQYIKNYSELGVPITKNALYYGNLLTGNYAFGANAGTATTPLIAIPMGAPSKAVLKLWMSVENRTPVDVFQIKVGHSVSFQKNSPLIMNQWSPLEFDLTPFAGTAIQIQLIFDTLDAVLNQTRGIYISDFQILSDCHFF